MSGRGGRPGGGDAQGMAVLLALKIGLLPPGQSAQPGPKGFVTVGDFGESGRTGECRVDAQSEPSVRDTPEDGRPDSGGSTRDAPTAIGESLDETMRQTGEWLIEKTAELLAQAVVPGVGHLVVLFFEGKELLEDAAAWASSGGSVELHIPLVHLPPGLELEVGAELKAKDGDEDGHDGPGLILFAVPGDGGTLGGWGLERKRESDRKKHDLSALKDVAVIDVDLSAVLDETDLPEQRMAILRGTAARLQSDLWTRPEYDDVSLIVIDDEQAGIGMWLARSETAAGMGKIVIVNDPQTGGLVVRIIASEDSE
jgi:hypothetical protein